MIAGLVDLLWPRICPVCEREIGPAERGGPVHPACLAALGPARAPGSGRVPVFARFGDGPGWFALLHAWKYGGQRQLAAAVARAMADTGPPRGRLVLVPVPDDPARRRLRGYGPATDLARELARLTGSGFDDRLLRRRASLPSQTACADDAARRSNAERAFATGELGRRHRSERLVLVDDQVTSGATVRVAAGLLGARGHAVCVWCAARSARAPRQLA